MRILIPTVLTPKRGLSLDTGGALEVGAEARADTEVAVMAGAAAGTGAAGGAGTGAAGGAGTGAAGAYSAGVSWTEGVGAEADAQGQVQSPQSPAHLYALELALTRRDPTLSPVERHAKAVRGMKQLLFSDGATHLAHKHTPLRHLPSFRRRLLDTIMDTTPPADLCVLHVSPLMLKVHLYIHRDVLKLDTSRVWQLRYFTLDQLGLSFVKNTACPPTGCHVRLIPLQHATRVSVQDAHLLVFAIHFDCHKIPRLEFRAPSREILAVLLDRLRHLLGQGETRDVVR
ncbi:hypothetical protein B484DRAFT_390360 [Ochromonadaceae sp. CCMP2298]|nr:hypothetical protein B484DRAFT_390360 [Ochromonadaceae sp. CCMP2298]